MQQASEQATKKAKKQRQQKQQKRAQAQAAEHVAAVCAACRRAHTTMDTVQLDGASKQWVCGGMEPRACEVVSGKRDRTAKRPRD